MKVLEFRLGLLGQVWVQAASDPEPRRVRMDVMSLLHGPGHCHGQCPVPSVVDILSPLATLRDEATAWLVQKGPAETPGPGMAEPALCLVL